MTGTGGVDPSMKKPDSSVLNGGMDAAGKGRDVSAGVVIFDLDDCLIINVHWYWAGWQMFKDVMVRLGFRKYEDELIDKLNEFDAAGVREHGFKKERFGEAMGETYDYYCQLEGIEADPDARAGIVDIGMSVYRHKMILYPHTKEVLAFLRDSGYELYCVTKGDPEVQHDKICDSGLSEFFCESRTFFVPMHKREALDRVMGRHPDVPREKFWFVGNSVKDDMKPAIEAGINGILIYEYTWHFDETEFEGMDKITRLDTLADIMDIL